MCCFIKLFSFSIGDVISGLPQVSVLGPILFLIVEIQDRNV